ncbi:MAG: DegV family protein [Oscillospiraceae bacterium]|jgi:DegV family protein with EDD domain
MRIKVTSESTCDLSPELVEKYNIGILPLYVIKDGKNFLDGVEITSQDIFEHVKGGGEMCSTAAASISNYIDIFRKIREEYDAVIHVSISSDLSACHQNAYLVASELDNVYVVDSRNLSTGISHLVLIAAEMAAAGANPQEITEELNRLSQKVDASFIVDTLQYLHKGGRCSAVAALGANLLNLKPCIEVKEGKLGVGKKYRGPLKKCLVSYVVDRLEGRDDVDTRRIFITDTGVSDEIYMEVEAAVRACQPFGEIIHTRAGCVISNHCGPNTLGILFMNK